MISFKSAVVLGALLIGFSGAATASSHHSYSHNHQCGGGSTPSCKSYEDHDYKGLYTGNIWGPSGEYSWAHNGLGTSSSLTSAKLKINAYDVDAPAEVDKVFAFDTSLNDWVSLGNLWGKNNKSKTTSFTLGSEWFDEIASGLQMKILFLSQGWATKLNWAKLYVDGKYCPPVSAVPVPAAAFLFAPALLGFMGLRRKAQKTNV